MTVYAEAVFISNFFIDVFLFALTLSLLKVKINKRRLIFSAVFGGAVSACLPLIYSYALAVKIVCLFLFPFIIRKNRTFFNYIGTLAAFSAVTLLLGGAAYALKCCLPINKSIYVGYGLIPVLFSTAGLCVIRLLTYAKNTLPRVRAENANVYGVTVSDGKNVIRTEAYYDSGNRVYAKNGEPVTIVSDEVYNRFCGQEDTLAVATVGGVTSLKTKEAAIRVDGAEGYVNTVIAKSSLLCGGYNIILHNDMFWRQQ